MYIYMYQLITAIVSMSSSSNNHNNRRSGSSSNNNNNSRNKDKKDNGDHLACSCVFMYIRICLYVYPKTVPLGSPAKILRVEAVGGVEQDAVRILPSGPWL